MTKPELLAEAEPWAVLVVEDEVLVRLVICEALREAGLRVVEAGDADQALAYLRTDSNVRLVFSDVQMPGSMDGVELTSRIRKEFPTAKVVLASGHMLPGDLEDGTLLLPKPYPLVETVSRIVAILDQAAPFG